MSKPKDPKEMEQKAKKKPGGTATSKPAEQNGHRQPGAQPA